MSLAESIAVDTAPFEFSLGDEHTEFSGSVRMMTEVANLFGVTLSDEELADWQTLGRASYVIDQYLDAERDMPRPNIAVELFSGQPIPGVPTEFTYDCRHLLERQSQERQVTINKQLQRVRFLVEAQAAADTVPEVVAIRHEEADLLADMLSLNTEDQDDVSGRLKFNSWLALAMRAGYLLDSLRDIKEDYESGASRVEPRLKATAKMAAYLIQDTVVVAKISPRALGKGAMVMARYEFRRMHPDFSKPGQTI